jgi:hypothetical protein
MRYNTPYSGIPNRFKSDLREGKTLIGCWSSLANPFHHRDPGPGRFRLAAAGRRAFAE